MNILQNNKSAVVKTILSYSIIKYIDDKPFKLCISLLLPIYNILYAWEYYTSNPPRYRRSRSSHANILPHPRIQPTASDLLNQWKAIEENNKKMSVRSKNDDNTRIKEFELNERNSLKRCLENFDSVVAQLQNGSLKFREEMRKSMLTTWKETSQDKRRVARAQGINIGLEVPEYRDILKT